MCGTKAWIKFLLDFGIGQLISFLRLKLDHNRYVQGRTNYVFTLSVWRLLAATWSVNNDIFFNKESILGFTDCLHIVG